VAQWKLLPVLPARPIGKVVHFTETQGILTADWPMLENGPLDGRFALTDLPGEARIQTFATRRSPIGGAPMFEYYDLSPDGGCHHLQVLNAEMNLQVAQDYESATRFETISLIENLNEADPITLRVQVTDSGQQMLNLAFTAKTLPELREKNPIEFEKYLRPMFRQFHQEEAVFAVEDKIAWQVMADDWQPLSDLARKIEPLIDQLNAPDFSSRAQAQESLRQVGQPAALYLRSIHSPNWTAEQKARVHKFQAEYFILTDDQVAKLSSDVDFLLDCLASDDAALRTATLTHLQHVLGRKIEYKLDQPRDDRMTSVEALRRQLTIHATTRDAQK
jgi:hypothetical protein